MARENAQRVEDEYAGYDKPHSDTRLLGSEEGLQGKVTNWEKGGRGESTPQLEEEAQNDAQYEYEREQVALAQAQEQVRRTIARKQAILKERHTAKLASKAQGVTNLARWAGLSIAVTAWFWQFLCGGVSLVGLGAWATISEFATGTMVGKALNWGLGFFGTSIEGLIPADSFFFAFWALAAIIAFCVFTGFMIWFYLTGAHVFDGPLIGLMTALTFALSIMPVSNIFPWIPLWVVVVNARSTIGFVKGITGVSSR